MAYRYISTLYWGIWTHTGCPAFVQVVGVGWGGRWWVLRTGSNLDEHTVPIIPCHPCDVSPLCAREWGRHWWMWESVRGIHPTPSDAYPVAFLQLILAYRVTLPSFLSHSFPHHPTSPRPWLPCCVWDPLCPRICTEPSIFKTRFYVTLYSVWHDVT